jgi:hypothetical protein
MSSVAPEPGGPSYAFRGATLIAKALAARALVMTSVDHTVRKVRTTRPA